MAKTPTDRKNSIKHLPIGTPSFATLQEFLTSERVEYAKGNPERMAIVRALTTRMMRDPDFMSNVETMLGASSDEADDGDLELGRLIERSSFGWPNDQVEKMPSPKAAAAAVGAAVAVIAAGPAAAVAAV